MPILDIENHVHAEFPRLFGDVASLNIEFPGLLPDGSYNPAVQALLMADLADIDNAASMEQLFHSGIHIAVERPGLPRRVYRVLELMPEGGGDFPSKMVVTGVDMVEHLKHIPAWADPSNRNKVVQLQFSDIQDGSAEDVSRKIIGRNLIGYQQPSLLGGRSTSWTEPFGNAGEWSSFNPNLHSVICSPIKSGIPSEWCVVEARWDNSWDLLKATWDAAGILPVVDLWWPGDAQPFPTYTILNLPTAIVSFRPRSTVTGAAGLLSQSWNKIQRTINSDDHITSVVKFSDAPIPSADGRNPWVVFELPEAPKMVIRKSTDHTFLVGGKSPKGINDLIEVGVKTALAAAVTMIPGIGPPIAEIIKGGGELLGKLAADRFLNINEFTDQARKQYHGRSGYHAISKPGEANTIESLQKAWQAKTETAGGLSVEFTIDDPYPYLPGRDFDLGDVVGVKCWGVIWAAYISELTWTSEPGKQIGWKVSLGNFSALADPDALQAINSGRVAAVIGRASTFVGA
ncbi:siphovirus ReqiPepy6 Gp37-like family protein [Corynebacterium callunae]|uniref:siphovirus ReqiPepy6 Gp37-like family protein n=1 Tax=Corynebacterium callunae TaxID=1721 RepID=UPI001FFF9EAB|nr:siphovirus ReqiPepy6 Gp37-like family protein [Corynebacterium callunae]